MDGLMHDTNNATLAEFERYVGTGNQISAFPDNASGGGPWATARPQRYWMSVNFYDQRFSIGFTDRQKTDLVNFLSSL